VRGSLGKEIIRRVVHQHINEVKFCYDQELARKPALAGRISVQFAISPVGQVITSVMQSTSMDDARVENCVVSAVRRWEFPKPVGGGIAIVLYPFNFTSPES
jgi:TonB family protein